MEATEALAWEDPKIVSKDAIVATERAVIVSELKPQDTTAVPRWPLKPISPYKAAMTFVIILVILVMPIHIVWLASSLLNGKDALTRSGYLAINKIRAGVADFTNSDYAKASGNFKAASREFDDINKQLRDYNDTLSEVAMYSPAIKRKLDLAAGLSVIGQNISSVADILSQIVGSDTEKTIANLNALSDKFRSIVTAVKSIKVDIVGLSPNDLPQSIQEKVSYLQDNFDVIVADLDNAVMTLDIAREFIGVNGFQRNLVLFQNNREIRPTGGFIGSFARLDFLAANLQKIDFPGGGTYDLQGGFKEHLIPPKPLSIVNTEWYLWDANWWPDFPTTAKKLVWFYEKSGGPTVDSVIAVNADFLPNLLDLTGPITLDQYQLTIDKDNFFDVIQKEVEENYDKSLNQPKKVLKDLAPLLFEKIAEKGNYRDLLSLITSALSAKDIQVYFTDETVQAEAMSLGWSGHTRTSDKDYLSVISANVAGGKSDSAIYETIDHQALVNDAGDIIVTTTITKEHRAEPDDYMAYLNNVDYLRVYVPLGSELMSASGFTSPDQSNFHQSADYAVEDSDLETNSGHETIDASSGTIIGRELNHTVFANWMQVAPGQTTSAILKYRLPFKLKISSDNGVEWLNWWRSDVREVDTYSLLVQRQSGKKHTILNSSILLNDKYKIVWKGAVNPAQLGVTGPLLTYSDELTSDVYYAIVLASRDSNEN